MSRQRVKLFLPGSTEPFRIVSQESAECMANEGFYDDGLYYGIEWRWHDPHGKGCREANVIPYVPTAKSAGSLRGESCNIGGGESRGYEIATVEELQVVGVGRHGPIKRKVRVPQLDEHGAYVLERKLNTLERWATDAKKSADLKEYGISVLESRTVTCR